MSGEPPVPQWSREAETPQCTPCVGETVPEVLLVPSSQQQAPKSAGLVPIVFLATSSFMTLDDSLNFSESQLSYLEGGKHTGFIGLL